MALRHYVVWADGSICIRLDSDSLGLEGETEMGVVFEGDGRDAAVFADGQTDDVDFVGGVEELFVAGDAG